MEIIDHIYLVDILELQAGEFNPKVRASQVKDLIDSMSIMGFRTDRPIVVGNDKKTIGDGHRRWTAAKLLLEDDSKFSQVPVIFSDLSAAEVFVLYNSRTKPIDGKQWLEATMSGVDIQKTPPLFQRDYNNIINVCGVSALGFLLKERKSPNLINLIIRTNNYIKRHGGTFNQESSMALLQWVVTKRQQLFLRRWLDGDMDYDQFCNAIERKRKLPQNAIIAGK